MSVDADLKRIFQAQTKSDGPLIPSMAVLEQLADTLGEIRASANPDSYRTDAESTLDWNTPAMDTAPIGMAISGPAYEDNPIAYVNDQFEGITGYTEVDLIGENLRLLQGPETASDPVDDLREALDIWAPVIVELRNYRNDGTKFWNRLALAPIVDVTGTVSNWVGFQEDITDRRS
ncbi:PAS domain S-box-containing protein [Halohasta litchfieldiae]|jgi:PAS domain S-box-containing protein|uniref:PAS domain S-box-containing protein n=1 Tax=Halohasta litchfieldiae TaxID=1073996 RepID=A0A1H6VFK9_9EURY|nr:PAS domain-containing protein [Halohasta litchfieldiae]ATW87510.1 PAS domain S-box-containing protein [Halohasta litchfieldiae]SEI99450.1 PAS domain S-box-containing protein [Halohasta litchfieldiae]